MEKKAQRWSVTLEKLMLEKSFRHSFCLELIKIFAHGKSIWLCEEIGHEFLMICAWLSIELDRFL